MPKRITTEKRAEAARINGAKSRGPKTPEGKARSSQNSLKHGAYSRCALLLANEEAPVFDSFRDAFLAKFQPADPVETSLVDEMVFARWRMRRYWFAQDATIDLELIRQIPFIEQEFDHISEPGRLSRAITTLVDDSGSLDFLHRVESRCNRQFHRALKDLLHLQSQRTPPSTNSKTPEIKNDESNPSPTQPSPDQQPMPTATAHFRDMPAFADSPALSHPPQPPNPRPRLRAAASVFLAAILALVLISAQALATQPLHHSPRTAPAARHSRPVVTSKCLSIR